MDPIRARKFGKFKYGDPRGFLVELRKIEATLGEYAMPDKMRRLRTNGLKPEREMRDAALLCVGISERFGLPIRFAPVEEEDFDFVATWSADQTQRYCPVQLKEVAPEDLNHKSSIDDVLKTLSKYSNAIDLTIAIKINRTSRFDPTSVKVPKNLKLRGLWIFASIADDQSKWAVWGDFMAAGKEPFGTNFDYPV